VEENGEARREVIYSLNVGDHAWCRLAHLMFPIPTCSQSGRRNLT
jgi:hypothetical protein